MLNWFLRALGGAIAGGVSGGCVGAVLFGVLASFSAGHSASPFYALLPIVVGALYGAAFGSPVGLLVALGARGYKSGGLIGAISGFAIAGLYLWLYESWAIGIRERIWLSIVAAGGGVVIGVVTRAAEEVWIAAITR